MRHAKAEPGGETDLLRELSQRGYGDALEAGRWLAGSGITPDAALVSSARRTASTWLAVAEGGSFDAEPSYSESLYNAGP
jgi:phosphohistidine phosphatase